MKKINELDLADVRYQMRQMYKQAGPVGAFQCLYELIVAANVLLEIITEESKHDKL